jgi:nicotinamidase-related amidase
MLNSRTIAVTAAASIGLLALPSPTAQFVAPLQLRVQPFKNSDVWQAVTARGEFTAAESAIVVCDMWDKHWCAGATRRVEDLARRMDPVLRRARQAGVLVIHAPSETMEFYKDYPQRQLVLLAPKVTPPERLHFPDPPLPIDDSDGGCDTPGDKEHQAWKRENPLLSVGPRDAISDNGEEIYNLLRQRKINTLFIMGVHANMCILNRSFAIKRMTEWGLRCVLVRDLTDAMYNPARKPFVSHAAGTELVIEHIEKYWCPSTRSADLLAALKSAGELKE